jgi:hypothetical protein
VFAAFCPVASNTTIRTADRGPRTADRGLSALSNVKVDDTEGKRDGSYL